MKKYFDSDPVVIGGVGGSGTRIIAEILKQSGVFMGSLLNAANDNMQLAGKFPYMRDIIQNKNPINKNAIYKILIQFEIQMSHDFHKNNEKHIRWGWKIPGNYFILKYLKTQYQDMKYIHIIRNGFDMAFSKNQNQLFNWGAYYGIDKDKQPIPKAAFRFWYAANKTAIAEGKELLKDNFLLIKFEELCLNPEKVISRILDFINFEKSNLNELLKLVEPPNTINRHKKHDLTIFDKDDFSKVVEFDYTV